MKASIRFSYTNEDGRYISSAINASFVTATEVAEAFMDFMKGVGFHECSVVDAMYTLADEITGAHQNGNK